MKEVVPQFTYQDTVLTFHLENLGETVSPVEADLLTNLDACTEVSVTPTKGGHTVKADIQPLLKKDVYDGADLRFIEKLLGSVNVLTPYISDHDEVLGLSTIGHDGLDAHIYPSFQTWLQSDGLNPEVIRASETAIYSAFGEAWQPPKEHNHLVVRVGTDQASFHALDYQDNEDATLERTANMQLTIPWLQTLGNCACLASDGSDRSMHPDGKYASLYKLKPHNIDDLRQVLSLVVGLGTLAAHAPLTFDETLLFKDVEWEVQSFPKTD
ncbi:MAG TPA: hypothetical protein VG992_04365 [Candidatus Saccharimonadales bacterium]|nr:hypothetical protein [Candidatus Saccharimonadales bacterium]